MKFLIIAILTFLAIYGTYELETYYQKNYDVLKHHKTEISVTEEIKPYPNIIKPITSKNL